MSLFLRFIIKETLAGRSDRIKEAVIGVEVFGKDPVYDPHTDGTVRTEASKLRAKLDAYYAGEGKEDPLVISVPKGGYVPSFLLRSNGEVAPPPAAVTQSQALPLLRRRWRWIAGAALLMTAAGGSWMGLGRKSVPKRLPTVRNRDARRLDIKGEAFMRMGTAEDLRNAIQYFNLAIAADPGDAPSRADLSLAYAKLAETETAPVSELILLAKAQARQALHLDRSIAEAHLALAQWLIFSDYDWDAAEREFREALVIDPAYMDARYAYAHICLTPRGLYDEAARQLQEGLKHDPLSSPLNAELASTDVKRGHIDQAIDRFRENLARYPHSPGTLTNLAIALSAKSRNEDALENLLHARRRAPNDAWIASHMALCYVRLGRQAEAQAILEELQSRTSTPDCSLAAVYVALGQEDAALEHLERAYAAHSIKLLWLGVDRRFERLRGNPRFQELLARLRLPSGKYLEKTP